MQYNIHVPNMDWLIGGSRIGGSYNKYYGSCGTDANLGFFGRKLFNYCVWLEKLEDETEIIRASVYGGCKSYDNTDESEIESKVFDAEQESIPAVKAWIEEKCAEFFD